MSPIWIVALVIIVVVLLGWVGGVLVVDARRKGHRDHRTGDEHPPPLPEDRDAVNGGVIRGDPGQTNAPPGKD